jgi:hypothetical protein
VNGVTGNSAPLDVELPVDVDLNRELVGFLVEISDQSIRVGIDERIDQIVEVTDVLVGPFELGVNAGRWIE